MKVKLCWESSVIVHSRYKFFLLEKTDLCWYWLTNRLDTAGLQYITKVFLDKANIFLFHIKIVYFCEHSEEEANHPVSDSNGKAPQHIPTCRLLHHGKGSSRGSCAWPWNSAARPPWPLAGCCGSGLSVDTVPSSQVCSPFPAAPPGSHPKPKTAPRALTYGHYIHKCGFFLTHLYYSTITISISNFCCCSHHKSCSCFYLPMRPRWSCVHCRPVPTFNRELLKGIYKISHHGGRHCCPGPVLPMWELWCAWREPRTASAKGEPRRQHQSLRSAHPSFLQMAPDWVPGKNYSAKGLPSTGTVPREMVESLSLEVF